MTYTKIALTGGPCGGKTTALSRIRTRMESFGYRVLVVPEAATLLFQAGLDLKTDSEATMAALQSTMLRTTLALERSLEDIANQHPNDKVIVLCDRGTMDIKAFCSAPVWNMVLDEAGVSEGALVEPYDAVIHMVTAAKGAEDYYTLENNEARSETPEQARAVDQRLQDAWTGHPHFRVVGNDMDFESKVRCVVRHVCQTVGEPEPVESERRFLVELGWEIPVHSVQAQIRQDYLRSSDGSIPRVRKWESRGHRSYTQTTKIPLGNGSAIEKERRLSPREYLQTILAMRDPTRAPVFKERTCFVWEGQYMELDLFQDQEVDFAILEVELQDITDEVFLPPFLNVIREITGDSGYSNYALAKKLGGS